MNDAKNILQEQMENLDGMRAFSLNVDRSSSEDGGLNRIMFI